MYDYEEKECLRATNQETFDKINLMNYVCKQSCEMPKDHPDRQEWTNIYYSCWLWFERRHIALHTDKETKEWRFGLEYGQ